MRIGQYQLRNRLIAAPMAGITDRPFRTLCYEMGAGLTVSEMMSSNPQVWESDKSRLRMVHVDEPEFARCKLPVATLLRWPMPHVLTWKAAPRLLISIWGVRLKSESQARRFSPLAVPGSSEINTNRGRQCSGRSCHTQDSHRLGSGTP